MPHQLFGIHLNTIAIKIIKLTKEDFLSVFSFKILFKVHFIPPRFKYQKASKSKKNSLYFFPEIEYLSA